MDQFFKITILVLFFIFKLFLAIFVFFCGFGFFFVICSQRSQRQLISRISSFWEHFWNWNWCRWTYCEYQRLNSNSILNLLAKHQTFCKQPYSQSIHFLTLLLLSKLSLNHCQSSCQLIRSLSLQLQLNQKDRQDRE